MADPVWSTKDVEEVLGLIGEDVCVLSAEWPRDLQTGDIDCAIRGLDHYWPLRLPSGVCLLQFRHYDINSWVWFIGRSDRWLMFDGSEDPRGVGRYKFPTVLARCEDGLLPDPAVRAAYLTAKRLRKDSGQLDEWNTITGLSEEDPDRFRDLLSSLLGERYTLRIFEAMTAGRVPGEALRHRALMQLRLRRLRNPGPATEAAWKGSLRWLSRLTQPTGMVVVIAGPDGSGKSTLAQDLPADLRGLFLRSRHVHWRPGILPSLGALAGNLPTDPTRPHGKTPHRPFISGLALTYHWLDFLLGTFALFAPTKARTGLVVVERGWWDMCVDPARYRINAPTWIVKALGHLLTQPDLIIVLEAEPDVLMSRKLEVTRDELVRQMRQWRELIPPRTRRVYLDASAPAAEVQTAAREAIVAALSDRAYGRLGAGWVGIPTTSRPRWMLPRGPREVALAALSIYQPITPKARLGWEVARGLASTGLLRFVPRGSSPPASVRSALAAYMPPRSTISVLRANHHGRFVASIIGPDGYVHGVAKVATGGPGREALDTEADNIRRYGDLLDGLLEAPKILAQEPGLLLLEPVSWLPRARPSMLPPSVAQSLGQMFARRSNGTGKGIAHGDCAPWNLLRTGDGWVLVDWEEAWAEAPPFYDLAHYVVQGHALLGTPSLRELVRDKPTPRWVADAVKAYSVGSGQPEDEWRPCLGEYLRVSSERLDVSDPELARAIAARQRLLAALNSS